METLEQFIEKKKTSRNQQGDLSGTLIGAPIESAPIDIDVPYTPPSKPEPRKNIVDPSYKWANQNSLVDREQPVQDVVPTQMAAPVQPMSLSQMPAQEPETAVSEVRAGDGISPMADLLVGATPALMGVLFGDSELGFGLGAGYLNRRAQERQSLDDKLKQLQMNRKTASDYQGRRFQTKNIKDPKTGKALVARFDQVAGTLTLPDGTVLDEREIEASGVLSPYEFNRRKGLQVEIDEMFNKGWKVDPLDGQLRSPEQIRQANQAFQGSNKPTVKEEKDFEKISKDFRTNKTFQDSERALGQFSTANALIQEAKINKNPTTIRAIKNAIARMSGEVGVMTEQDVEGYQGSQALKEIARRWVKEQKQGIKALPEDLEAMQAIVDIYADKAKRKLGSVLNSSAKQYSQIYGKTEGEMLKILGPMVDPLYEMGKRDEVIEGKNKIYTKGQRVDGYEFLGGDESDPKNYRKLK